MKKRIVVIFIFIVGMMSNVFGQDNDSLSKAEQNQVNVLIQKALEDTVSKVDLGTFLMKKNKIKKYFIQRGTAEVDGYKKNNTKKIKNSTYYSDETFIAKSVRIEVKDFTINRIYVILSDGSRFMNKKAPISLINFEDRYGDKLFNSDNTLFIRLGDVLDYSKNFSVRYYPNAFHVNLNAENIKDSVVKPGNLNSLINYNIFSDFGGLFGERENAWLQFEADGKFPIFNNNIPNTPFYVLHDISPYFNISQRNNEFYELEADTMGILQDGDSLNFNSFKSLKIVQRAWLNTGFNLNIFHYAPLQNHLEIKMSAFVETNIAKTRLIDGTSSQIDIFNYGGKMIFHFSPMDNFGFKFSTSYSWMKFNEKINVFDNPTTNMLKVSSYVYLTPFDDTNKKLFLRYNYFNNVGYTENDFFQIQLGYRAVLKYKAKK